MKVLITGKNGQVGTDLVRSVPVGIELFAFAHSELDITSEKEISCVLYDIKPDFIVNAAAYTAVDRAEIESDLARSINAQALISLTKYASEISARLIHLSTDFVFDGSRSSPYLPDEPVNPLSIYGKTKAEGENIIRNNYAANSIILRTSWVYSVTGRNFVKSMLQMMRDKPELSIVKDQIGSPTWSRNLALTIWAIINNNVHAGIYHWSDSGVASWYDFAIAIYEEAIQLGIINNEVKIIPINTTQYPTPATRPRFSVLETSETIRIWGVRQEHWRVALRKMLLEHKKLLEISNDLMK